MDIAAIAIAWCLLGQDVNPRYTKPHIESSRKKPAAPIEDAGPAAESPAEPPATEPPADAPSLGAPTTEPSEPSDPESEEESMPDVQPGEAQASALTPVDRGPHSRLRPPELLAQALQRPADGALVGKPLALTTAIARTTDRQQQLRITQAYWRLSAAEAAYHWARDAEGRLHEFVERFANTPAALSARAAARADVLDAELTVTQCQQDLANLLGTTNDPTLPLSTDRPHVGAFQTYFESIFGNRAPPPRIRLIHRTLPLRQKGIDLHGEAIVAALDAVAATGEDFQENGRDLSTLLVAMDQLKLERRAFITAVRDYNLEFAEYLFTVLPSGTSDKVLASRLILSSERATSPTAPPAKTPNPRDRKERGKSPDQAATTGDDVIDALAHDANYQPGPAAHHDEAGLYGGLLHLNPVSRRVQKLSGLLHWDRALPDDIGQEVSLVECLRKTAPASRQNTIDLYWRTRERAARYQAAGDHLEQLNALATLAIGMREQPQVAKAGVRLQATRRAAQATVVDEHLALVHAQFDLTQAVGGRLEAPWLIPTTSPQAGGYVAGSHDVPLRSHWAEMVRRQHARLEQRCDAVLRADASRVLLINESKHASTTRKTSTHGAADRSHLDQTLWAVGRQYQETLGFLSDVTQYNRAIARFALAVSPPSVSGDELTKLLVTARSLRGES